MLISLFLGNFPTPLLSPGLADRQTEKRHQAECRSLAGKW